LRGECAEVGPQLWINPTHRPESEHWRGIPRAPGNHALGIAGAM
jgi:hypothetical protein